MAAKKKMPAELLERFKAKNEKKRGNTRKDPENLKGDRFEGKGNKVPKPPAPPKNAKKSSPQDTPAPKGKNSQKAGKAKVDTKDFKKTTKRLKANKRRAAKVSSAEKAAARRKGSKDSASMAAKTRKALRGKDLKGTAKAASRARKKVESGSTSRSKKGIVRTRAESPRRRSRVNLGAPKTRGRIK